MDGVQVEVHLGGGSSGPVLLWFARVLGIHHAELTTVATAKATATGNGSEDEHSLASRPWDITFVVDVSDSMGERAWRWRWVEKEWRMGTERRTYQVRVKEYLDETGIEMLRKAMHEMSQYFAQHHREDRTGLTTFNHCSYVKQSLGTWNTGTVDQCHAALRGEISNLTAGGATYMAGGLSKAIRDHLDYGRRRGEGYRWAPTGTGGQATRENHQHIVLMSDGRTVCPGNAENAAREAKRRGIRVDTVAFGADVDEALLKRIAEITGGRYYDCTDVSPQKLAEIFKHVKEWSDDGPSGADPTTPSKFVLVY